MADGKGNMREIAKNAKNCPPESGGQRDRNAITRGVVPKPKLFAMGTTPRTTFGRAALLTKEGSFRSLHLVADLQQHLPGRAPRFKFDLRLRRIGQRKHKIGLQLQFAGFQPAKQVLSP